MAKQPNRYRFTVEGFSSFPFDMLRYDSCWPEQGVDAAKLEHHQREVRQVTLAGVRAPSAERWHSFGWLIVGSVEPYHV